MTHSEVMSRMGATEITDRLFKCDNSKDEILKFYDYWAKTGKYDEHLSVDNGYRGPGIAAKTAADLYEINQRQTVKILDVAAGTGFVSQELRKHGFKEIDALDPSASMLAQAKKKGLYNNYICDFLNEQTASDLNGFYDCITSCGGFGKGHIPVDALKDLIRLTKKGGYVVIVMREEYLHMPCYDGILEPLKKSLEEENKWKMLQRTVVPCRLRFP